MTDRGDGSPPGAGLAEAADEAEKDPLVVRARSRLGTMLHDKWHLDVLLGVGGMAAVYAATHRNGSRAAIKVLHPEMSTNPVVRERFLWEGYAANAVGHEGTVKVLDDDAEEDGGLFLITELLDGETFEERRVRLGGRLPAEEVLFLADKLLDVLAAAHGKGIIHRDLKPENVFLTRAGNVKVLDFGIARLRQLSTAKSLTQSGTMIGTPAYMAPEHARGLSNDVDERSDLWSCGAMMFCLLSGRNVHEGRTVNEQLVNAITRPAPSLAAVLPTAPSAIVRVVDRALEFSKDMRWAERRQDARRRPHRVPRDLRPPDRRSRPPVAREPPEPDARPRGRVGLAQRADDRSPRRRVVLARAAPKVDRARAMVRHRRRRRVRVRDDDRRVDRRAGPQPRRRRRGRHRPPPRLRSCLRAPVGLPRRTVGPARGRRHRPARRRGRGQSGANSRKKVLRKRRRRRQRQGGVRSALHSGLRDREEALEGGMFVTPPRRSARRLRRRLGDGMAGGPVAAAAEPTKRECVAANEDAQDLRHAGKLREARRQFAACTAAGCPSVIREDCAQRLREVEAALPSIVFVAKDRAGHDLTAVHVAMDGDPLIERIDGTAVVIDPGEHKFVFVAEGFREVTSTLLVHEGESDRPVRVVLESSTPAPEPLAPAPAPAPAPPSSGSSILRPLGITLAVVGVGGIGVGAVFGLASKSTYDRSQNECPTGDLARCQATAAQAQDDLSSARSQALASTIAFAAGGAFLAAGAILFFVAPKTSTAVTVGVSAASGGGVVSLGKSW